MIETPKVDALLAGSKRFTSYYAMSFPQVKQLLADSLQKKHIWNTEFEHVKDVISRTWETANDIAHEPLTKLYYHDSETFRTWNTGDPRFNMGLTQLLNIPGFVAKLKKIKNAPELAEYIAVCEEFAALASSIKEVKPFIQKGRKPSENPVVVDMTGTGHCSICGQLFKLNPADKMVHHGFQISDGMGNYFGTRLGSCFGVGYAPYELSNEGNQKYLVFLEEKLEKAQDFKRHLEAGDIKVLMGKVRDRQDRRGYREVEFQQGTPEYDRAYQQTHRENENYIGNIEFQISIQKARIADWKLAPLPYGPRKN